MPKQWTSDNQKQVSSPYDHEWQSSQFKYLAIKGTRANFFFPGQGSVCQSIKMPFKLW